MTITGKTLVEWNIPSGPYYKSMIETAQNLENAGFDKDYIYNEIIKMIPETIDMKTDGIPFEIFLDPENDDERSNLQSVITHMDALMKLPTVVKGAVMPDSMPSGSALGTIPVGGVIVTKDAIHPGMHSADICCSMAISIFEKNDDVKKVLDTAMKVTHFGYGKRSKSEVRRYKELMNLLSKFENNSFLKDLTDQAESHFMTQGDGNHFFYVGSLESSGQMAIVTHHGSRGLGAQLYKLGMAAAKRHTAILAPNVPEHNAWIDATSEIGKSYWEALQLVREWTKMNHYAIHDSMSNKLGNSVVDRFWNEHNFVFKRDDGLFYHAKGATPSFDGFSADDDGRTLIPLNMSEPILITKHSNNEKAMGFAPHGAGRNFSRSEHERRLKTEFNSDARGLSDRDRKIIIERETAGLDVRFYTGSADLSELPSSYKNAKAVQEQIQKYNLATVSDRVLPLGSIMAGNLPKPWKDKKKNANK
jgi:tRNA-splicing ligase RtcB (3'-phosphate/5'-hydroxy nucleic acid ligase)